MCDEDLLEAMVSVDVPLNDIFILLSNYHIFEMDCPTIKPRPGSPFESNLTICESLDTGVDESSSSAIEL